MSDDRDGWRADRDYVTARAETVHNEETEFGNAASKASADAAIHALRGFLLINGGAAISILAFSSRLVSLESFDLKTSMPPLATALLWFAWGVASSAAGLGFAFLTNQSIAHKSALKTRFWEHPYVQDTRASRVWFIAAIIFQVLGVMCALASLIFFLMGIYSVTGAILEVQFVTSP